MSRNLVLITSQIPARTRGKTGSGQRERQDRHRQRATGSGKDKTGNRPVPGDGVIASEAWQSQKQTLCGTGIGTRPCYAVRLPRCARNDILLGRCFMTTHHTVVRIRTFPGTRRQAVGTSHPAPSTAFFVLRISYYAFRFSHYVFRTKHQGM